ncbi:unnamed protein product [Fusarium graminearum]|uniref:Uncharacterized protein n=1 Tax=Gibberella zeae TaxID=5518 RepID=A0A2H3FSZ9_GIBZA|nr:hypothetical protein HG531_013774 [Fusarium graminearum]PCD18628.1 hypothetical protein FGRA07_06381 [Fusarium graminearum]CAF3520103.1 unnamed protein product [Fusarium graminearum]CAF3558758.1 unnamed protein product [Fusarium graminearum]CAF3614288.1 unnamed protein product [Fusarium graminearum]
MQQPASEWFDELVNNFADTIHEPEVKFIDESAVNYLLQSWVGAGPQCRPGKFISCDQSDKQWKGQDIWTHGGAQTVFDMLTVQG